jgi:hypothetical protein
MLRVAASTPKQAAAAPKQACIAPSSETDVNIQLSSTLNVASVGKPPRQPDETTNRDLALNPARPRFSPASASRFFIKCELPLANPEAH